MSLSESLSDQKHVWNFGAGPATLPASVLEKTSRAIIDFENTGLSILEISHRSPHYEAVHNGARARLLKLMNLSSETHEVLFLGGGASTQFAMLPMAFLTSQGATADYVHTGEWSARAISEARRIVGKNGHVNVIASSEEQRFSLIPSVPAPTEKAAYIHITTNNTIEGTEYARLPETGSTPLVADASSNILGRAYDYSRFSIIYAGAQKNLGPAGVTVVVIRKDFLEKSNCGENLPTIFQYQTHAKNQSLYNTPPVFAVYTVGLMLEWMESLGGVAALHALNEKKAGLIYAALDRYPDAYEPTVTRREDRSWMNITFRCKAGKAGKTGIEAEKKFLSDAEALGLLGLKGYRTIGGIRASLYNAMPLEGALVLENYLHTFALGK